MEFCRKIALTQSEADLHRQLPKSNRNQIKWGQNNLMIEVVDRAVVTVDDIDQFRALHIDAAGRETRSQKTWEKQFDMVRADEAFLVFGRLDNELVTAALFSHSSSYCFYGVSASKRGLFGKPISHAAVWRGVLHAKKLGCRHLEWGEIEYPNQATPAPTEKRLGITVFKRGFGGTTFARMRVSWDESDPRSTTPPAASV